jgi:TRAP-type C4-dicarboxylate transport system permease small subunit
MLRLDDNPIHTLRWVIGGIEKALITLLLTGMILLAGSQILLRNLFDSGWVWADPVLKIMVLWIALLGALIATQENRHIRIDLLSHYLSERNLSILSVIHNLFSAVICGIISWHAARFVYIEWQDGTMLILNIPTWVGEIIIPIGFAMMCLKFLLNISSQNTLDTHT